MTSRERMLRLIVDKKPADRIGIFESYWPETIRDYWIKEGYPTTVSTAAATAGQTVPVDVVDHFGYDMVSTWPITDPGPLKGQDGIIEENEETKVFKNGYGSIARYWKNKSGTPDHLGFTIKSRADWDRVKEPLLSGTVDVSRMSPKGAADMFARAGQSGRMTCYGNLFLVETMRAMLGDMEMLPALLLEPDWIHDICRTYTDFYKLYFSHAIDNFGRPDAVWIYEDLGFRNGLFASPATLRELILPYYKELIGMFKNDYQLPVLLHSCGNIVEAVPLVIEAGFDVLQPMEAKAGVDVLKLADTYGDKLCYMGNIDVTVLNTNDRAKVKAEVERKVGGMVERRLPYILHSDHSIPPDVRYETYQYMVEVAMKCGKY